MNSLCADATTTVDGVGCDDGNECTQDACDPETGECSSSMTSDCCGNGVVEGAEDCDDGNSIDNQDGCSGDCRFNNECGDGVVQEYGGEQCDDGNIFPNDGCSQQCLDEGIQPGIDFGDNPFAL